MNLKKRLVILSTLLIIAAAFGLAKGAVHIPLGALLSRDNQVILGMRLLRILVAVLAGSGLAVSGIVLQAVLRNPLAEPYLLGTSSGAGLFAVTAVILGFSRVYVPLAAFIGAIASVILVYGLAREGRGVSDRSLVLSGVIISISLSAAIVLLVSLFGNEAMHEVSWWLWGSLQVYEWGLLLLVAPPVLLGIAVIYLFAQELNAISLGEEEATHLGVEVQSVKKIMIVVTALITSSLICICGIIGFVGLIVPHLMRLVVGPNHRVLIPTTCLAASLFLVACDILSRTLFGPVEVPIGVLTALIGAPVFIVLLKKSMRP